MKFTVIDLATINKHKELEFPYSPGLVQELIEVFLGTEPERIAKIVQAARDLDFPVLCHEAHILKSSAANLGAKDLSHTASELEERSLEKSSDVKILIKKLQADFKQAQQELSEILSKGI